MSSLQRLEHAIALYTHWFQQQLDEIGQDDCSVIQASDCSIDVVWGWLVGGEASFDSNPNDPVIVQVALRLQSGFLDKRVEYRNQDGTHQYGYLDKAIAQWEAEDPEQKAAIFNYPTPEHLRMEIARRGLFYSIQDDRIAKVYDEIVAQHTLEEDS